MLLFSGEIASLPDDIHLLHADCHRDADFLFPKRGRVVNRRLNIQRLWVYTYRVRNREVQFDWWRDHLRSLETSPSGLENRFYSCQSMVVLGIYYRNSTIHGMNIVGTTTFGDIGINVSWCFFVNYKHACHKGKIHATTYHGNVLSYTLYPICGWVVWFSKFCMN